MIPFLQGKHWEGLHRTVFYCNEQKSEWADIEIYFKWAQYSGTKNHFEDCFSWIGISTIPFYLSNLQAEFTGGCHNGQICKPRKFLLSSPTLPSILALFSTRNALKALLLSILRLHDSATKRNCFTNLCFVNLDFCVYMYILNIKPTYIIFRYTYKKKSLGLENKKRGFSNKHVCIINPTSIREFAYSENNEVKYKWSAHYPSHLLREWLAKMAVFHSGSCSVKFLS